MTTARGTRPFWRTARGTVQLDRPRIAGILNVTPDSFWTGGRHAGVDRAIEHAARLIEGGADLVDVGGESTRPGASPVSIETEMARIIPVVLELSNAFPATPISVDTVKSEVARAAMEAGAAVLNDVSGLRLDPALGDVAADSGAGLILMHSRGPVDRMASYDLADYSNDPVGEIVLELERSIEVATRRGVWADAIILDPGFGFAKRTGHSVAALSGLGRILALGFPVLVGVSRKRFIGELGGGVPVEERLEGTLAASVFALFAGARLFRAHDVPETRRALDVAEGLRVAQ
jgi:dihydropteroate synthase